MHTITIDADGEVGAAVVFTSMLQRECGDEGFSACITDAEPPPAVSDL